MSDWKTMPLTIPTDGATCWVRLNYWFGQPYKAVWNDTTDEWTSVTGSIVYPAWVISRWKYVV